MAALLALMGVQQHLSAQQRQDIAFALLTASPGTVTAGSARLADQNLSLILTGVSIIFFLLQVAYLIWRWRRDYRKDQREEANQLTRRQRRQLRRQERER